MSPSHIKIIISALSLALLVSAAALYIGTEETNADDVMDINDLLSGITPAPDGVYYPGGTIVLPILMSGETATFDGEDIAPGGVKISGFDFGMSPLIVILSNNRGTFTFKNLELEAPYAIDILGGGGGDSVVFENVLFTGNREVTIYAGGSNLIVDSCKFEYSSDAYMDINVQSGNLNLKNSVLYSHDIGVAFSTYGSVVIDNCYITADPGNAVMSLGSYTRVNLTVRDSTILTGNDYGMILYFDYMTSGNSVVLLRTVFSSMDGSGAGVRISGDGSGTVDINQCQFENLRRAGDSVFSLDIPNASFTISDSTFYSNTTQWGDGYIYPAISIGASSGYIRNSTFWNNTVAGAPSEMGCILLGGTFVDITYCTFLDNYCYLDTMDCIAASVEKSSTTSARLTNSIIVAREDDSTLSTPIWGGPLIENGANILWIGSVVNIFAYDIYGPMDNGNNGKSAGCNNSLTGDRQEEVITIPIRPGGDADGVASASAHSSLPTEDQRGRSRINGLPDLGSVCIDTATFNANGGSWDMSAAVYYYYDGYSMYNPFVFSDRVGTGTIYNKLVAAAENEEVEIRLPYYTPMIISNSTNPCLLGWSTSPTAVVPDIDFVDLSGYILGEFAVDQTYYAVWGDQFVVIYKPLNGLPDVAAPWGTFPYAIGMQHNGMTLTKWGWDPTGIDGGWDPTYPPTYNQVVYGVWVTIGIPPTVVTVEFRDGASTTTVTIPAGSAVSKPADPVREGQVFLGWFTSQEGGSEWDFSTYITSNLILYAHWQGTVFYIVTFDPCNGDAVTKIEVEKGTPSPVPKVIPTKPDHAFMGWYTAATGGALWDFTTPITENTTLYGQWGPITENSVIFDPQNGGPPIIIELKPGVTFTLPQDPSKKGFKFLGWYTDPEGGTKWDPSMPLTPGMKLYAHWEETSDEGGWMEGEETIIVVIVVVAGVLASVGVVPMAFAGGAIATQAATSNVFQQGLQGEHMHGDDKSGEEKNRRSVIFDPKNGRSSWGSSVMGGRQVSQPSDPKPPKGMKFSHWSESPEGGAPFNFMTPINKTTHLYAIYVKSD